MSSEDTKKWMEFCKHMREAIIDEQKAVPDYTKLIEQATQLYTDGPLEDTEYSDIKYTVLSIIEDEKKHKRELLPLFDKVCPKMAFHRDGIEQPHRPRYRRHERKHHRAMQHFGE